MIYLHTGHRIHITALTTVVYVSSVMLTLCMWDGRTVLYNPSYWRVLENGNL